MPIGLILALAVFFLFCSGAYGVVSYFRLGSEATALRQSVMSALPGQWDTRIALHVGPITTGLVRAGSRLFTLKPEPRAALEAVHRGEFGLYKLQQASASVGCGEILSAADQAMNSRDWIRVVGVVQSERVVAVYVPRKGLSAKRMGCCVMVWNERQLIVASAHGNIGPLLELAEKQMDEHDGPWHFARR